ncbi:MAG: hypothetical protein WA418_12615 [Bradyrhizobium sp.]
MATGQIFVTNSDNYDDFVTLRDMNAAGSPVVGGWNRKRLNATDRQKPATVEIDGSGFARVKWFAERADDSSVNREDTENPPVNGEIFVQAR